MIRPKEASRGRQRVAAMLVQIITEHNLITKLLAGAMGHGAARNIDELRLSFVH